MIPSNDLPRRHAVTTTPIFNSRQKSSSFSSGGLFKVVNEQQQFCLIQIAGKQCHPQSDVQQIRIVRFIPNPFDTTILNHTTIYPWYTHLLQQQFQEMSKTISLHLIQCGITDECHQDKICYSLCSQNEKSSWEYRNDKVERLCKLQNEEHVKSFDKFQKRIEHKKRATHEDIRMVNIAPNPIIERNHRTKDENPKRNSFSSLPQILEEDEKEDFIPSKLSVETFPVEYEMRGQKYAVLGFIEDYESQNETAISPIAAFEHRDDAIGFIEHLLEPRYPDQLFGVVSMYEWFNPHLSIKSSRKKYRLDEENRIFEANDQMHEQLETMKIKAKFENCEIPITDIHGDLLPHNL